jgi:large subunit ribosomal protein L3
MCKGLIGKKLGMTGLFDANGRYIPVTAIEIGPCVVTQVKTKAKDGYNALQLNFGKKLEQRINRPMKGHLAKSGLTSGAILKEVPVENPEDYKLGQVILPDIFEIGEKVDITGITKGRGFSGVIKRHGFHGGKKTHGSHSHRIPGSIGCSATPSKVIKGKKLPGRYGFAKKTIRNLTIVDIREDQYLLLLKGAIPGPKSGLIRVTKTKARQ